MKEGRREKISIALGRIRAHVLGISSGVKLIFGIF